MVSVIFTFKMNPASAGFTFKITIMNKLKYKIYKITKHQIQLCSARFVFLSMIFSFPGLIIAQGDLLLFPKRVVFEEGKRTEIINLANTGDDTIKYTISFVQIRMNENGSFENISAPDSNQFFADPYIRFYPRTVSLAPRESQFVKLQITGTNSLAAGEYRSHLYFRAEPVNNQPRENLPDNDNSSFSIKLIPVYGMTIPIIIRIGEPNVSIELSNLTFQRDRDLKPNIRIQFHRTGNRSVYGNIVVNYVSTDGQITQVGEVSGFAVYTPGSLRNCIIQLREPKEIDYNSGELNVVYSSPLTIHKTRLVGATLSFGK